MNILLSDVVAHVESSNNPLSMRYEPHWAAQNMVTAKLYATGGYIDMATAQMICQTSWGKYQIMGDNLYGKLEYKDTLVHFLTWESYQDVLFNSFIESIGFKNVAFDTLTDNDLHAFAIKYNGSPNYATALKAMFKELI